MIDFCYHPVVSINVPVEQLADHLHQFPWAYLATVTDVGTTHALAIPTSFVDGAFEVPAGRSTRTNIAARPHVTMIFPPARGTEYSLIVDGRAEVCDESVRVVPTGAVLHRPALSGHCS